MRLKKLKYIPYHGLIVATCARNFFVAAGNWFAVIHCRFWPLNSLLGFYFADGRCAFLSMDTLEKWNEEVNGGW